MDAVAESPSPASTGEGDYLPATILPPTCHLLTGMLYFIGHNRYLQAIILLCVCEDVYKSPAANLALRGFELYLPFSHIVGWSDRIDTQPW